VNVPCSVSARVAAPRPLEREISTKFRICGEVLAHFDVEVYFNDPKYLNCQERVPRPRQIPVESRVVLLYSLRFKHS
jgi:hypothetical protein